MKVGGMRAGLREAETLRHEERRYMSGRLLDGQDMH